MEIVVWFLAEEKEAKKLRETYTRGWPEVKLSKLFTADLFMPLFSLLDDTKKTVVFEDILDQSLYVDPELNDLDLIEKGEAYGVYVKRVNPTFVEMLARIGPQEIPAAAKDWYASPEMTAFYESHGWAKQSALQEVERMLTDVVKFAKRALKENKAIMQIFSL